jgi:hypothetical protein
MGGSRGLDQGDGGPGYLGREGAQERLLKVEVESAASLAFVHGEASKLTQKVAVTP